MQQTQHSRLKTLNGVSAGDFSFVIHFHEAIQNNVNINNTRNQHTETLLNANLELPITEEIKSTNKKREHR